MHVRKCRVMAQDFDTPPAAPQKKNNFHMLLHPLPMALVSPLVSSYVYI
jgi:hypothetical protein